MNEATVDITLKIRISIPVEKNFHDMTIKEWKQKMAKHAVKAIKNTSQDEIAKSIRGYDIKEE